MRTKQTDESKIKNLRDKEYDDNERKLVAENERLIRLLGEQGAELQKLRLERDYLATKLQQAEEAARKSEEHHKHLHQEIERLQASTRAQEQAYGNALKIVAEAGAGSQRSSSLEDLREFLEETARRFPNALKQPPPEPPRSSH